jgi:hypothetical protein
MSREVGANVYLLYEIVKHDKSGVAYNLFMRASKKFYEFIAKNPRMGAQLRDSFLRRTRVEWDQSTEYRFRGYLHRIDGPALIERRLHMNSPSGYSTYALRWYHFGRLHRVGGPAIEYAAGRKEYYVNGRKVVAKKAEDTVDLVVRRGRFAPY